MPDPLVVQMAHQFQDELVQREAQAVLDMATAWLDVEESLKAEVVALAEQLVAEHQGQQVSQSTLMRMKRAQTLFVRALEEVSQYSQLAMEQINAAQETNALAGIQDAAMLTQATADYFEVSFRFDILPVEAVENIVGLARAGQPLGELLERAYPETANGLINLLIEGTAKGRNPRETARLALQKGLAQGLNHFLMVARDQQIRAYRTAALQQYQKSGVVRGYQRLAAKNDRTCLACLALDGQEQETDELMPLHRQDRCTVIPMLKNLPTVKFETGREWFSRQTPEQQEQMLGPERYKAWRAGKFTFPQLAAIGHDATWGPTTQVRSLRQLENLPAPPKATLKGWKRQGFRGGMWTKSDANIWIYDRGPYGFELRQGVTDGNSQYFGTRQEAILAGNEL
jgi:hypothetical protein